MPRTSTAELLPYSKGTVPLITLSWYNTYSIIMVVASQEKTNICLYDFLSLFVESNKKESPLTTACLFALKYDIMTVR